MLIHLTIEGSEQCPNGRGEASRPGGMDSGSLDLLELCNSVAFVTPAITVTCAYKQGEWMTRLRVGVCDTPM